MLNKNLKFSYILLIICCLFQHIIAQGEPIIFSATGDIPYGSNEVPIFQQQIEDQNLYSPSEFFVHLGDIKEQSDQCPEIYYSSVADDLLELAVPVFIVPGDNETTDCPDPVQAWDYWVQYFMDFQLNFCSAPITEKQAIRPENFAFVNKGVLFIGINLVSGVSSAIKNDDAAWVEQQFQEKVAQVRGAVIFSQCGPPGKTTFFDRFVPAAQTFAKPILFLHGDGHTWIQDYPWPTTAPNVLRVEVDNGGDEEPVQVTVTTDPQDMFIFLRNPFSNNPQIYNVMPCVQAGSDQQIDFGSVANLQGKATDDGVPISPGALTITWSKTSGPGTVTFDSPDQPITTAAFSAPGDYLLRLTADDGELQNYDEINVTVVAPSVLLEAKIYLEGPYEVNGDSMRTDLWNDNDIPLVSPYPEASRTVDSIPAAITDWVLVELRESPAGTAVASKSAFLRDDGRIVADDGIGQAISMNAVQNSYYIVVKHRNHLAVMSADLVPLNGSTSTLYDFTTGTEKVYGGVNAMTVLGSGVYGMFSGDANNDGQIQTIDKNLNWRNEVGLAGYRSSDFDLNGQVQTIDKNLYWRLNVGRGTQLP